MHRHRGAAVARPDLKLINFDRVYLKRRAVARLVAPG